MTQAELTVSTSEAGTESQGDSQAVRPGKRLDSDNEPGITARLNPIRRYRLGLSI